MEEEQEAPQPDEEHDWAYEEHDGAYEEHGAYENMEDDREHSDVGYERFAEMRSSLGPDNRFSDDRRACDGNGIRIGEGETSSDSDSFENHSQSLPPSLPGGEEGAEQEEEDGNSEPLPAPRVPRGKKQKRRRGREANADAQAIDHAPARAAPHYSEPIGCKRQRVNTRAPSGRREEGADAADPTKPSREGYWRTVDPLRCLPVSRSALLGSERPHYDTELRFDKIMSTRTLKGKVYRANTLAFNEGGGQEGLRHAQETRNTARIEANVDPPKNKQEEIALAEDGCTAFVALLASRALKAINPKAVVPSGAPNVHAIADAIAHVVEGTLPHEQACTIEELSMELPLSAETFPVRTCTLSTTREADAGVELDGNVLRLDGGLGSFVRVPHAKVVEGGRLTLRCTLAPRSPPRPHSPAPSGANGSEAAAAAAAAQTPPPRSPAHSEAGTDMGEVGTAGEPDDATRARSSARSQEKPSETITCTVVIDSKGIRVGKDAGSLESREVTDGSALQLLFSPWNWTLKEVVRVRALHSAPEARSELQLDPVRAMLLMAGLGGNTARWADALFLMADELILAEMVRSTRGTDKYEFWFCDESTCRWELDIGDVQYKRLLTRVRKAIAGMMHDLDRTAQLARDCLEQGRMNEDEIMALCDGIDPENFEGATMEGRRETLLKYNDTQHFKKILRKVLPEWHPDGKCRPLKTWVIRDRFAASLVGSQPKNATVFDESNLFPFDDGMAYDPTRAVYRRITPQDRISLSCGYDMPLNVTDADKEKMLTALRQIHPRKEVLDYKLDLKARCLDASPGFPILLAAIGNAGGGKGLENAITKGAFGKAFAKTIDKNLLLDNNPNPEAASPKLADLQNLRLIAADEVEQVNAQTVKRLTGGDTICARPLFGRPVEFIAKFFLVPTTRTFTMHHPHAPTPTHIPKPQTQVEMYANFKDTDDGQTIRCDSDGGISRRLRAIRFTSQFIDASNAEEGAKKQAEYDREYAEAIAKGIESPPRRFSMWKERAEELIAMGPVLMAILIGRHQRAKTTGWLETPEIVGEWTSAFQATSAKPLDDVLCDWVRRCPCKPRNGVTQPSSNDLVFENTGLSCPHTVRIEYLKQKLSAHSVADGNRFKLDVIYGLQNRASHKPLIAALHKTRCIPCASGLADEKAAAAPETTLPFSSNQQDDRRAGGKRAQESRTTKCLRLVVNERYKRTGDQRNVICGLIANASSIDEAEQKIVDAAFAFAKKANARALAKMGSQSMADEGNDASDEELDEEEACAATVAVEKAQAAAAATEGGEYEALDEDT